MSSVRSAALATEADATLTTLIARADASRDTELGVAYHDRRVADVLAHLHAWHVVFDGWVAQDRSGAVPAFPAEGFTWKDLDALNDAFYRAHRARPYEALRAMLLASHRSMLSLLDTFTEEELDAPDGFAWLGGQPLGDVANECLAAHYQWGLRTFDAAGLP